MDESNDLDDETVRHVDLRGLSFREFVALNGGLEPDDSPADWVAWFADARFGPPGCNAL